MLRRKPLIAVLEPDVSPARGGLTREAIEALLTALHYKLLRASADAPSDVSWVAQWQLDDEINKWGYAALPTGEEIVLHLFASPCIEWNRLTAFQEVTLRLIAERTLSVELRGEVYVQGEVGSRPLVPPPLTHGRKYNLYCSRHNHGAAELALELRQLLGKPRRKGCLCKRPSVLLPTTDVSTELHRCEHMLVYLTSATWTSGEQSKAFAHEVCEARRLGIPLLLVHEMPSVIETQAEGEERRACDFNDFWNEGWTPQHLLVGDANLYKQIATALKPGEWRKAGLAAVIRTMHDSGGGQRHPIHVHEPEQTGTSSKSSSKISKLLSSTAAWVKSSGRNLIRMSPNLNPMAAVHAAPSLAAQPPHLEQGIVTAVETVQGDGLEAALQAETHNREQEGTAQASLDA